MNCVSESRRFDLIAKALRASAGIYTSAAAMLNCSRNTVKGYVERYPHLQRVLEEIQEARLDLAETVLVKAMDDDDLKAAMFDAVQELSAT